MKEKRVTKKAILASLLSVVVCSSMLIGTSYAWFTDTATSSGNVIKSGKLDIELSYLDGTTTKSEQSGGTVAPDPDDENADWKDASKEAIFDYDLWEPGYCAVKHIKIANVGNLALKYQFNIIPSGTLDVNENGNTLADAIDVYYFDPAKQISARDDAALANPTMKATLTDALAGLGDTGSGVLYPEGTEGKSSSDTITLVLKMREDVGNEYQDMDLGTSFAVQVIATQYTYEADSFDDQYDAQADTTPDIVMATDPESFAQALANAEDGDVIDAQGANLGAFVGKTVEKEVTIQNAVINGTEEGIYSMANTKFKEKVTFKNCTFKSDGGGYQSGMYHNYFDKGAVFENCTVEGGVSGFYSTYTSGDITFNNCTLIGEWCYAFNVNGKANGDSTTNTVTFNDCVVKGWVSFDKSTISKVVANNTKFIKDGATYATMRLYQDAEFTNCEFAADYNSLPDYGTVDICAPGVTATFDAATAATVNADNLFFVGTATGSKYNLNGTEKVYGG